MRFSTALPLLLAALPATAFGQPAPDPGAPPGPAEAAPARAPRQAPPSGLPPPPPADAVPAAPEAAPPAASPQPGAAPAGHWVFARQYGWVWMPYGQQYTYIPGDPRTYPEQYVYYPVYGWRWVVAPWVYGYGPQPYWGTLGVRPFAWYARPWFRVGGYWGWGGWRGWGHYRGWMGPRAWGHRGWAGAPAYYRTGVGERHLAPAVRPRPARHRGEHRRP